MSRDPAFLFYDGDAARDVSHMNRLERGCYFDLIQAQLKFGAFTIGQARVFLGKDFDSCWPSVSMVLGFDGEKYSIPWVVESVSRRKRHSELQKGRANSRWDKCRGSAVAVPQACLKENEIENENEKANKNVNGVVIPQVIIQEPWLEESEYKTLRMLYNRNKDLVHHLTGRGFDQVKAEELAEKIMKGEV